MVRIAMFVLGLIGQAQAQTPRSHVCEFHGGGWARAGGVAPDHTIVMTNDGWCGNKGAYTTTHGAILKGAPHSITLPPQHGQVVIVPEPSGAEGVFYRPEPRFTGGDKFIIHNNMLNQDRTYNVVIQ